MKKLNISLFVLAMVALSSCTVIGGIFKAGAAVGVIAVIVIIGIILWIISAFRGKQ
ncbi:phosphatidate cytidylyltransferase [Mucilaginibacter gilvus]|uniref:Phosphatidate cytidylyltransferase n=1 Tax=Mucilaginibacter gilvus TaxID=2305909 RepID=A0A3S3X5F7_9SPHI|nr:phosphatidate cytidylyltransferase [Mucilaginibacter gilvus]RWY50942.1 phosphatidate cytidylyltransferase [Mucilaginibacter gilvus]